MKKLSGIIAAGIFLLQATAWAGGAVVFFASDQFPDGSWPACVHNVRQIPETLMYRVQYEGGSGCLDALAQMAGVVYVEQETVVLVPDQTAVDPDRPFCTTLMDKDRLAELGQGDNVLVAVIDTGISRTILGQHIAVNTLEIPGDGLDNDQNGYVDDVYGWNFGDLNPNTDDIHGHGTQVASIVAATAPDVHLLPVKVSSGLDDTFTTGAAAEAIYYAVSRGADVLNLSFSAAGFSVAMSTAIIQARDAGVLVVAAAGNNGLGVQFPAYLEEVVAVGSHDAVGLPAWFSPFGMELDILAPGQNTCVTGLDGLITAVSGTSFSAPFVSGAAAVLLSMNPYLTYASLRKFLAAGTLDIMAPGFDPDSGHGMLDAVQLVNAATPQVTVPAQVTRGDQLSVGIALPPTNVGAGVYLALLFNNTLWWMDSTGSWFDANQAEPVPFDSVATTGFTTVWTYGQSADTGPVDTGIHQPGKYLWAVGISDKFGKMLAPVGWTTMDLIP